MASDGEVARVLETIKLEMDLKDWRGGLFLTPEEERILTEAGILPLEEGE